MLNDLALKRLELPPGKPRVRIKDSRGLFVELRQGGGKWWRLRYSVGGKEKMLSLGTYPEVSLREAREKRDEARVQLARGVDPSEVRKAKRYAMAASTAGDTFEAVAREWYQKQLPKWSEVHKKKVIYLLEKNIFPALGKRPVGEITPPELLAVLRKMEARDVTYTANRMRAKCGEIFRYAIATGRIERDPAADLRGALGAAVEKHRPAVLDPERIGQLLLLPDMYRRFGSPAVVAAMRVLPYVFVRPGELYEAKWADVDIEGAEWRFTASKTGVQMIVPLSTQVIAVLRELQPVTGHAPYVFPNARSAKRPMSNMAIMAAYQRFEVNGEQTAHGWRATARTLLDETLHFRPDWIETQLGHAVRDPNGRAYNRTSFLTERRQMMQAWADYLDGLEKKARKPEQ
jgi:integrase